MVERKIVFAVVLLTIAFAIESDGHRNGHHHHQTRPPTTTTISPSIGMKRM